MNLSKDAILRSRVYLYGGLAAVLFSALAWVFAARAYPIAMVNGTPIPAARFTLNVKAANFYYANLLKAYGESASGTLPVTPQEIEASVLSSLIDQILVTDGAEKEVGKYLKDMALERIDSKADKAKVETGSLTLYGLSYEELRQEVLMPQAVQDILSGRLYLRGENFEDWIHKKRKEASVAIFLDGLTWDGEKAAKE